MLDCKSRTWRGLDSAFCSRGSLYMSMQREPCILEEAALTRLLPEGQVEDFRRLLARLPLIAGRAEANVFESDVMLALSWLFV
jgi:hypothetical protein